MFVALVVKISPSAGPIPGHATTDDLVEAYAIRANASDSDTSCGLNLVVKVKNGLPSRTCTLGGLIIVNGAIAGLTAGHPFQTFDQHAPSDPAQVAEDLDNDESSEVSSEPFVFNEDDNDSNDTSSTSSLPLHADVDDSRADGDVSTALYNESPTLNSPFMDWQQPLHSVISSLLTEISISFGNKSCSDHDWALLEDLPPAISSHFYRQTYDSSHHSTISETTPSGTCGSVVINVLGNGPRLGYLHSSPASMKVDMCVLEVQLITLEQALRKYLSHLTPESNHTANMAVSE